MKAIEYQLSEGYCKFVLVIVWQLADRFSAGAPTTVRVVARSIPHCDLARLPPQVRGPSVPSKLASSLDEVFQGRTRSSVVYGSEGYEAFIATIRKANHPHYRYEHQLLCEDMMIVYVFRVSANFLRPSLFGVPLSPSPVLMLLYPFFGGHFSPIVGYDEATDLVLLLMLSPAIN